MDLPQGKSLPKAKTFDINEMMNLAKKTAQELQIEKEQKNAEEIISQDKKKKEKKHKKDKKQKKEKKKKKDKHLNDNTAADEDVGPAFPTDFEIPGEFSAKKDVGPELPKSFGLSNDQTAGLSSDSERDSESEDENDGVRNEYPVTDTWKIQHGSGEKPEVWEVQLKTAVTAFALNHQGARVASGGADYNIHYYDFGGMDYRM